MSRVNINNGDSGLVVRNALNAMFTELYSSIIQPLKFLGQGANFQFDLAANTFVTNIYISATSGTPTIRIGTAPNGQEILPDTTPGAFAQLQLDEYFANLTTIYVSISGGAVNIRLGVLPNFY